MAQRPRVVVTGAARKWSPSWWYLAGAQATWCSPIRVSVRHRCESPNVDAVIIGGGDDISPSHYNQPPEPDGEYDPDRDDIEIRWIQWALENRKPLLGICRGSQLINVVLGGELDQNIKDLRKLTYNRPGLLPTKQVFLEKGSLLSEICKKNKLRVNSLHSQIVKRVGVGMRATGWDLDGFIQASESDGRERAYWRSVAPGVYVLCPQPAQIFRWLLSR